MISLINTLHKDRSELIRMLEELQEQVEKYKAEIRESCEDMRSEYRTCDLAHELGEQVKELEADYGLFVEIVSSQEEQLAIIEGNEQLATEQALAAEAKVKELQEQVDEANQWETDFWIVNAEKVDAEAKVEELQAIIGVDAVRIKAFERRENELQAKLVEIKALLPKWYDIDDDFASICADELQAILEKSDE